MTTVITRQVTPDMSACLLTHMAREAIDTANAIREHALFAACLRELGADVVDLPPQSDLPDAVFVEDTIHVTDEIAVMASPTDERRRRECASIEAVVREHRPIAYLTDPARLEGGDVIRVGRRIFVGRSTRTNDAGFEQFRAILAPYDYEVVAVDVTGCLHLKTAGTHIGGGTILINPDWCDTAAFAGTDLLHVHPDEPWAGNAVSLNGSVILVEGFDRTRALIEATGRRVVTVPNTELAKAEGGLTCCSIIIDAVH